MSPSSNPGDTNIDLQTVSEQCPLLLNPSYSRSKSLTHDELRNFRISLKLCALDHSSCVTRSISHLIFIILTVLVPIVSTISITLPSTDSISFNRLVQLPESILACIAFFTLACFFRSYGLRQLLFLNELQDDSRYVRREYARELDKAFKHLAFILVPSFFVEVAHKTFYFSKVTVSIPYFINSVPSNSIVFIAVLASWVYRTGVFLVVCVFFKLTCELQILRLEGFKTMFEGCGSDIGVIFSEHMRIRKQLSVTSHRYRLFIILSLVTITISQLGALLLILTTRSEKSLFSSGDLVVCSAVQLAGFVLCLIGAARITHRAQGIVSVATRWHMLVTCSSNTGGDTSNGKDSKVLKSLPDMNHGSTDLESSATFIIVPSQDTSFFQTRQALVTYLQHNNGGITLFGFALDRGLLHTLFAFEFSLVLWILSKVVVLS